MTTKGTIIVTGASRGIGASIAIHLARQGFTIACLTRRAELPPASSADSEALARCVAIACDVTKPESMRAAFAQAAALGKPVVGVVNNAGVHLEGPSDRFSLEDYETVFATNATSVFLGCQNAYPHLLAAGGGLIVNIGSFFDKMGVKRNLAYCASKAAVGAITRCLGVEWASKGIRVMDIAPGYISTDLNKESMEGPLKEFLEKRIPGRKPGTAEDVAKLVAALFTIDSPFLTGETIYIDGAHAIAH